MSENDHIIQPSAAPSVDCDAVRDLIPAYSLGTLDPDERAFVERMLSRCPEAAADLRDYQAMAEAMLFSAPQSAPSPAVKNRLMAAVAESSPAQSDSPTEPLRLLNPRRRMALLVASVALLIVTNLLWLIEANRLRQQESDLTARVARQDEVIRAMSGSETNRVELASTRDDTANVSIVWWAGPQEHTWVALLQARDLPPLAPNMDYQLWMRRGDLRISPGVFSVDAEGNGVYIFTTDEPIGSFESMGITTEPAGGSVDPTGSAVVRGQF